jgi:hypothetical protein
MENKNFILFNRRKTCITTLPPTHSISSEIQINWTASLVETTVSDVKVFKSPFEFF